MGKISTELVHAGDPSPRIEGAVNMPIFQSANFEQGDVEAYSDIVYARLNNTPNHRALHIKLATVERGEDALVLGSGMAAISSTLLGILSAGDHLLIQKTVYGGTHSFVTQDLRRLGIEFDFIEADKPETWTCRPNTKAIYVESISNPLMEVPELEAVVEFARRHGIVSIIDNTFATPVNFRPLEIGFDLSVHSATKYLNGHSDITAGAVIGARKWIHKINHVATHLGGMLDPHACFLLQRGMKTLLVRMQYQNASAARIALELSRHPRVSKVNYPGLENSPSHLRARKWFSGCGGVLSFEVKGDAVEFMKRLRIPIVAASLGGVESLVIQPARSTHLGLTPEERQACGISDGLIRLSVGLEDTDDLIADLNQALG